MRASCRWCPSKRCLRWPRPGAGVLQLRSVEYARNHGVRIHCRSSFEDAPGTVVLGETETMEQPLITAVTHSTSEARITLTAVPDEPGAAARIFAALAEADVNVDMIVQNEPTTAGGLAEISFTVPREDLRVALAALEPLVGDAYGELAAHEADGQGLDRRRRDALDPGCRGARLRGARRGGDQHRHDLDLPDQDLVRIAREQVERAVQALHGAFELAGPGRSSPRSRSGRGGLGSRTSAVAASLEGLCEGLGAGAVGPVRWRRPLRHPLPQSAGVERHGASGCCWPPMPPTL